MLPKGDPVLALDSLAWCSGHIMTLHWTSNILGNIAFRQVLILVHSTEKAGSSFLSFFSLQMHRIISPFQCLDWIVHLCSPVCFHPDRGWVQKESGCHNKSDVGYFISYLTWTWLDPTCTLWMSQKASASANATNSSPQRCIPQSGGQQLQLHVDITSPDSP